MCRRVLTYFYIAIDEIIIIIIIVIIIFVDYVDKFPVKLSIGELQKITILGTCYIVRRFLSSCV